MANQAPSSSITSKWTYDVFLSFYGDDTRLGFTGHLHRALCQRGIRVFLDDECIRTGENITPTLFRAIKESRTAIVVFSGNYANSTFCLRELAKILKYFKNESRLIYPVFYHVDPSELRNPKKSYAKALAQLEKRFKDKRHKVEKWRQALSQAADLKGCHLKPKIANEEECITRIAKEVATRINQKPLHVADYPIGLVPRVKEILPYLDIWSTEKIKMIGICGLDGIGKSTIARALYNSIADNFEGSCFLSDVRKKSAEPNGLSHLQGTLLSKLVMAKDLNFGDYHEGIPIIQSSLSQKKILLILDDVDKSDQLEALAGSCDWFACGSRIIITTEDKKLLKSHGIESIYDVEGLNKQESLKLLSWYAFKRKNVGSCYLKVFNSAVDYSCGFPSALKVIGSIFGGKSINLWNSALQQFKSTPNGIVFDALKSSYGTFGEVEKQVFLDLACFFNGETLANIVDIFLCVRDIELKNAMDMLIDKSLIKIEQARVTMHGLIEDVGKEIVRQKSPNEPGERSRLWVYQDILHVLEQDTGTNKVEVIILDLLESREVQWSGEELMKMKNLKMLVIRNACFSERPKYLPNSLRWLEWKGYSFLCFPVLPTQLVYLDLSDSSCLFLQPFDKKFPNLSRMNLRNCESLRQIPDLSGASNLTELWLDGCTSLIEIHDSVGCLDNLRKLNAMGCKELKIFPSCLRLASLEHLNLFGCSSLQRFPEISIVMEKMQILDLDKTAINELPSSICNLIGLGSLSMEKCPNLKQLPASICTLPNLWKLTTDSCGALCHFKMREGGDEASLYFSAMSSKMQWLCFSKCNLSDDSLAFCLSHFANMIELDLSFNNFTFLPECIKEYHNLKFLSLNNCIQLEHIGGMPPNLDKFSAICCTSLTESSKIKVFKALNIQPGKRNFILHGKELPKGLHYYNQGSSVSFWVRNVFPLASIWILFKYHRPQVWNNEFSVRINHTEVDVASFMQPLMLTIKTDHIYICDMQSLILSIELPLVNKWNKVHISFVSMAKEIYFGVHVYNLQSNLENIQFMDPRRYIIVANSLQKIQEQQYWKDVEEDMNLDSNSTKYVESLDNPMHYQERDIMEKLRPYWDLKILKVDCHSYNNLIELHQINCKNCWRIPALGQLPALKTLTIEGLESVVAIGSEFFHGDDSASLVPFPSLQTLHFENMISWVEWNSIDMDAFPNLRTLRFHDCPKLIGNLPPQLLSLEGLEIERCPLLGSSIPYYPHFDELVIIKSPNVVLQEQELPRSLRRLTISGRQMSEPLFEKMDVADLFVRDCTDEVPLPVIHMPHSVKGLTIADCENLKFDLVSKEPLRHLRRISIYNCKFLRSLFHDMKRLLPILEELFIKGCPKLEPFSITLPSSLQRLEIRECDKLLSYLTEFHHLPTITQLCIYFPNAKWHCERLRHLNSQELQILDSPNIEKIEEEIMPLSLQRLHICEYGFLLEQCRDNDDGIRPEFSYCFR
ncbi:hypothetical protein K1719_001937 [Acacia pycnantha]|nr:hypothetical protein K1719_001937 [Acacia pycnantha]